MSLSKPVRLAAWGLFAAAAIAVLYFSLRPGGSSPYFMWWDKVQHFAAYGAMALLAGVGSRSWRQAALWAAGLAVAGYALEIVQSYVGRSHDLADQVANTLGCLAGFAASRLFARL